MKTIFFLVCCLALIACGHRNAVDGGNSVPLAATLSSLQANIFTPQCVNAGCHPGGGAPMSLAVGQSYRAMVNVPSAYTGFARVTPGNSNQSALYLKVAGGTLGARMPLGGQSLARAAIDSLRAWIDRGALNN